MKEYKEYGYDIQEFENLQEVLEHIRSQKDLSSYTMGKDETIEEDSIFFGAKSLTGEYDKLRYGDEKQTDIFKEELSELESFIEQDTDIFMDNDGFAYDMGAVVSGEPECCLNIGAPEPKKALNIYVDIGYSGGAKADSINNRGLAIVKLVNTLIAKGIIVNVKMIRFVQFDDGKRTAQMFKIPTDYMTMATVGYLCTSSFYRVIGFLLTAIQIKSKRYRGESRSRIDKKTIEAMFDKGDLYIPGGWIKSELDRCNKQEAEEIVFNCYENFIERKYA